MSVRRRQARADAAAMPAAFELCGRHSPTFHASGSIQSNQSRARRQTEPTAKPYVVKRPVPPTFGSS
eukprot:7390142-Prymnesium_polylepis.2